MHVNVHSQGIRPQIHMNCFGPSTLCMKNHFLRHGLKVSDSLLSVSVLEVCVYSIVGDTLPHSIAVMDEHVVCKAPVIAVVVLHPYVGSSCVPLKKIIGVYSILGCYIVHAVNLLQVQEVIHEYSCISVYIIGDPSFHVSD